jgi:hypothetical protein
MKEIRELGCFGLVMDHDESVAGGERGPFRRIVDEIIQIGRPISLEG